MLSYMKRLIICVFILISACKQEYPSVPRDVIPFEKMTQILADMHITDAVAATKAQGGMDEKLLTEEYYLQIYKNYGITKEDFVKSYHFYEGSPKLFNKLYDQVLSEISKREAVVGK